MTKNKMKPSQYDILIVEDSKYIIELLFDIIISKGFSCKAARNFPEVMAELNKKKPPKLIFLDINLPDLNGYKFCKYLKSEEKYKDILVYYLTGNPQTEVALKVLETRADGYITKPFDLSSFKDVFDYIKNS